MNLCSDNHDEVCFEGRDCPCCYKMEEAKQDLARKDKKISVLEERIKELEKE